MRNLMILVCFASLAIGSGCGDNPVNNSNNNPPPVGEDSLVMSIDSLSLYGTYQYSNALWDTLAYLQNDSLKLEFNSATNCTNLDTILINIQLGAFHLILSQASQLNTSHTWRCIMSYPYWYKITLEMSAQVFKYLKLSDIKLYKITS